MQFRAGGRRDVLLVSVYTSSGSPPPRCVQSTAYFRRFSLRKAAVVALSVQWLLALRCRRSSTAGEDDDSLISLSGVD